jgi:hypothetical protein
MEFRIPKQEERGCDHLVPQEPVEPIRPAGAYLRLGEIAAFATAVSVFRRLRSLFAQRYK